MQLLFSRCVSDNMACYHYSSIVWHTVHNAWLADKMASMKPRMPLMLCCAACQCAFLDYAPCDRAGGHTCKMPLVLQHHDRHVCHPLDLLELSFAALGGHGPQSDGLAPQEQRCVASALATMVYRVNMHVNEHAPGSFGCWHAASMPSKDLPHHAACAIIIRSTASEPCDLAAATSPVICFIRVAARQH